MQYQDFKNCDCRMESGYCYAAFTDTLWIRKWPLTEIESGQLEKQFPLLLELRIFNELEEYRWIRSDLSEDLRYRYLKDSQEEKKENSFDELQYMDIDEKETNLLKRQNEKLVASMNGGSYEFPIANWRHSKVRIRNYISYVPETNQAYVSDWRIVGFTDKDGKEVQ